ncbi:MAG: phosphate ABC transporter permease subunit PstC [Planctomycetota bacterium]
MSHRVKDGLLLAVLRLSAVASGSLVVLVAVFLVIEAWPALSPDGAIGIGGFVSDPSWHPIEQKFNLVPMVAASLLAMGGAMLLAVPLGVASALFCSWFAPKWLATPYRRVLELLAGIPSVVYGFWGLVVLVPLIGRFQPPGASLLAGVLILAVMVLPTVALLSEAAIQNVPRNVVRGASALGLDRWSTVWRVVLPAARGGIATACLLAACRAIGETMAVLMVCGNVVQLPGGVFDPVRALTANIALEMGYAFGDHRSALFVTGLILLAVVVVLVLAAEWVGGGRVRNTAARGVANGGGRA